MKRGRGEKDTKEQRRSEEVEGCEEVKAGERRKDGKYELRGERREQ